MAADCEHRWCRNVSQARGGWLRRFKDKGVGTATSRGHEGRPPWLLRKCRISSAMSYLSAEMPQCDDRISDEDSGETSCILAGSIRKQVRTMARSERPSRWCMKPTMLRLAPHMPTAMLSEQMVCLWAPALATAMRQLRQAVACQQRQRNFRTSGADLWTRTATCLPRTVSCGWTRQGRQCTHMMHRRLMVTQWKAGRSSRGANRSRSRSHGLSLATPVKCPVAHEAVTVVMRSRPTSYVAAGNCTVLHLSSNTHQAQ